MKNQAKRFFGAGVYAGILGAIGCTVGPNYERPAVEAPVQYRGAAPDAPREESVSLGEQPIEQVFTDPELRQLIEVALQENEDLMLAANRVLSAEASAGIVDAAALPTVRANLGATAQRQRFAGRGDPISGGLFQLGVGLTWEVEFWGKLRRAKEAARAQILASEWGRRAVITGLVSQVATRYFQLRALDDQLDIAQRTLGSRQESLRLTQVRETGGAGSLVDVRQAEQLVFGASAQIIELRQ